MREINYALNKTAGFPHWQDSGMADLRIHGQGMDLSILLKPISTAEKAYGIIVEGCRCKIHNLGLSLYETQHDWIYGLFGPIVRSSLQKRLERMIEEYLKGTDFSISTEFVSNLKESLPSATTAGQ